MAQRSISAVFGEDHDRLDALFKSFQDRKRDDPAKARQAFEELKRGLQRHIVWEEHLLFPLWERKTGITSGGPTQVMRTEHRAIEAHLEAIQRRLQTDDRDQLDSDAEEHALLALLGSHNVKEERVLYPSIVQTTSEDERAAIYRTMDDLSERQPEGGCKSELP